MLTNISLIESSFCELKIPLVSDLLNLAKLTLQAVLNPLSPCSTNHKTHMHNNTHYLNQAYLQPDRIVLTQASVDHVISTRNRILHSLLLIRNNLTSFHLETTPINVLVLTFSKDHIILQILPLAEMKMHSSMQLMPI